MENNTSPVQIRSSQPLLQEQAVSFATRLSGQNTEMLLTACEAKSVIVLLMLSGHKFLFNMHMAANEKHTTRQNSGKLQHM